MGAIKTMKEVEGALPQKKEINYVRALDKDGNPILISKEDLAQVCGRTVMEKITCYKLFCNPLYPSSPMERSKSQYHWQP